MVQVSGVGDTSRESLGASIYVHEILATDLVPFEWLAGNSDDALSPLQPLARDTMFVHA